jgi:ketosteroid isomerase-like protein
MWMRTTRRRFVKVRRVLCSLWLALIVTGCAGNTLQSYQPKNNDESLIVASLMRIPTGISTKSVETILQAYAEDAYVGNFNKYLGVATDRSAYRIGKPELRQAYTQTFRAVKEISMDVKDFRLTVQGDRAVAEAFTELIVTQEAGRKEAKQNIVRNEVTWRLKRGPFGWRIQEEVFH